MKTFMFEASAALISVLLRITLVVIYLVVVIVLSVITFGTSHE